MERRVAEPEDEKLHAAPTTRARGSERSAGAKTVAAEGIVASTAASPEAVGDIAPRATASAGPSVAAVAGRKREAAVIGVPRAFATPVAVAERVAQHGAPEHAAQDAAEDLPEDLLVAEGAPGIVVPPG